MRVFISKIKEIKEIRKYKCVRNYNRTYNTEDRERQREETRPFQRVLRES